MVFALAAWAPLANQPNLFARQVAVVGKGGTIAHPDPGRGEPGGERPLGAASPGDASPWQRRQDRLGLARFLVRHRAALAPRGRKELHGRGVDLLVARDADG